MSLAPAMPRRDLRLRPEVELVRDILGVKSQSPGREQAPRHLPLFHSVTGTAQGRSQRDLRLGGRFPAQRIEVSVQSWEQADAIAPRPLRSLCGCLVVEIPPLRRQPVSPT